MILENALIIISIIMIILHSLFTIFKSRINFLLIYFSILPLFTWAVFRIMVTGHAPFSGVYESMIFFTMLLNLKIIFFINDYSKKLNLVYFIPSLLILIISLFLPYEVRKPDLLVPVLRSFIMYIHIPSYFIGIVSLTIAFILSLIAINDPELLPKVNNELKIGFFFITIGLITGSFWAELSWSKFWSWDVKEIWSLITWLIMINAIHHKNKLKIIFTIIAYAAMIFTYFGVSFFMKGLHAY